MLNNLYRQLEPTAKKFNTLLKLDPRDDSERGAFNYFKRFIPGFPESDLAKLVKFITPSIDVTFIKYGNEFSQRPIAHTCSLSLELPATYHHFCELRDRVH